MNSQQWMWMRASVALVAAAAAAMRNAARSDAQAVEAPAPTEGQPCASHPS